MRNTRTCLIVTLGQLVLFVVGTFADTCRADERAIRRSDVVFMYDNPEMYEPYGCTVMGWAGSRGKDRIDLAHSKGVRLFSISVGFLTEFRGMIDFSDSFLDAAARNVGGEPFIVPWLWDHKHKGESCLARFDRTTSTSRSKSPALLSGHYWNLTINPRARCAPTLA